MVNFVLYEFYYNKLKLLLTKKVSQAHLQYYTKCLMFNTY